MESDVGINFSVFLSSLVNTAPGLAVWIVALVLSIVLSKRGGGKLERFLIAGSILILVSTFLSVFVPVVTHYLFHSDLNNNSLSNASSAGIISGIKLFLGLISLAGIICLFYAVWKKFNVKSQSNY